MEHIIAMETQFKDVKGVVGHATVNESSISACGLYIFNLVPHCEKCL